MLEELLPELTLRSGWKWPKGWTVVTTRICYPDPHRNARLTPSLCECWKRKTSALGYLCEPASAEESCLTQGHTSFLGWLGSDSWLTWECIDLVPGSPQDNSQESSQVQNSAESWLRPLLRCITVQPLPLPSPASVMFQRSCMLLFIFFFIFFSGNSAHDVYQNTGNQNHLCTPDKFSPLNGTWQTPKCSLPNLLTSFSTVNNNCLIPGLGRCPGVGNGNPVQYSCLENLMDRRA